MLVGGHASTVFPLPTLLVNIGGCFLIGLISGLASAGSIGQGGLKLFLTVGFCGGFTTFSTFCNEDMALLRSGQALIFALYAVSSVFLGLLAVWGGMLLAHRV